MFTWILQCRANEWREKKSKMAAHGNVTPTSRSFLPFSVFFNQPKKFLAFNLIKFDWNVFNLQYTWWMKLNQQIFTIKFSNRKVVKIYQNQAKREMLYSMYVKWFNQLHSNLTSAIRRLWWQKNRQSNIARLSALFRFLSNSLICSLLSPFDSLSHSVLCRDVCEIHKSIGNVLWIYSCMHRSI